MPDLAAEWPTVVLLILCYSVWATATTVIAEWNVVAAVLVTTLSIVLHSSLQHEVIHGHPFASKLANAIVVFPALNLSVPYLRFRDTHLAHHVDENLTDPYDDPETNFLDPEVWANLPKWRQNVLAFNNTLLGRLMIGPMVSQFTFMQCDFRAMRAGDRLAIEGWLWHVPAVVMVMAWLVVVGSMPVFAYLCSAYLALSILKIRTYLEHRAEDDAAARTVVIEDRGPLAFLFLNNNFHVVHHMHPGIPWCDLPKVYFSDTERYLTRNKGYKYKSYFQVFRRYFLKAKDTVPHPLWRR